MLLFATVAELGYSSLVKKFTLMFRTLGLIPSTTEIEEKLLESSVVPSV
jgi:hypothetical protein